MGALYTYKGETYFMLMEARLKNPVTREWEDCIIYVNTNNPDEKYVRVKEDFVNLFKSK